MSALWSRAVNVYVSHALESALNAQADVDRMECVEHATKEAANHWVQLCRNAETYCGVYGLAAIDRAEEYWYCCLQRENDIVFEPCGRDKHQAQVYKRASICYANALHRQVQSDDENLAMWCFAGAMYDHMAALEGSLGYDHHWRDQKLEQDLAEWKREAALFERMVKEETGHDGRVTVLQRRIAHKYHSARAKGEIHFAHEEFRQVFDEGHIQHIPVFCAGNHMAENAAKVAEHLKEALAHTRRALATTCTEDRPLKEVWQLCADLMVQAAEAEDAKLYLHHDDSALTARQLQKTAQAVASAAEKLQVVMQYLRALPNPDSAHVRAVSSHLQTAFTLIGTGVHPDARHTVFPLCDEGLSDLESCVKTLERAYHMLKNRDSTWDQAAIARFTAAAKKIDAETSPAHPFLKQCWLRAAEHLQLSSTSTEDLHRFTQHRHYSRLYEKLALGPFTTAAGHLAKADNALTVHARELWGQAAQALISSAIALFERMLQGCEDYSLPEGEQYSAEERRSVELSVTLAQTADCCDRVDATAAGITSSADGGPTAELHRLYTAELQLRLVRQQIPADDDSETVKRSADIRTHSLRRCRGSASRASQRTMKGRWSLRCGAGRPAL